MRCQKRQQQQQQTQPHDIGIIYTRLCQTKCLSRDMLSKRKKNEFTETKTMSMGLGRKMEKNNTRQATITCQILNR